MQRTELHFIIDARGISSPSSKGERFRCKILIDGIKKLDIDKESYGELFERSNVYCAAKLVDSESIAIQLPVVSTNLQQGSNEILPGFVLAD